jgi:hypothetical protein
MRSLPDFVRTDVVLLSGVAKFDLIKLVSANVLSSPRAVWGRRVPFPDKTPIFYNFGHIYIYSSFQVKEVVLIAVGFCLPEVCS